MDERGSSQETTLATFDGVLRRDAAAADDQQAERVSGQRAFLVRLTDWVNVPVLASQEMWR